MDATLSALLSAASLTHLEPALRSETANELGSMDRSALLAHGKRLGLTLSDRQKLATAVAKAMRADGTTAHVQEVPPETVLTPAQDLKPQDFSIYCHRTTLADGTSLSNSDPAPEFIIAALEQRTGSSRPPDAATMSLEHLNLWFMGVGR